MLNIADLIQTDAKGQGVVNILAADKLLNSPRLYATFLLWMLSELFETLPEIGDPDKPKLVFFFDEAHLLFDEAPKVLVERIELVVRLVRSRASASISSQNPWTSRLGAGPTGQPGAARAAPSPRDREGGAGDSRHHAASPAGHRHRHHRTVGRLPVSFSTTRGRPSVTSACAYYRPAARSGHHPSGADCCWRTRWS